MTGVPHGILAERWPAGCPGHRHTRHAVDQTLVLTITADEAGELHVHSTPEHQITIDRPGVVEVESHEPDLIVLQLEVR